MSKPIKTVADFINAIKLAKDIDIAPLAFAIDGEEASYRVKSMSQFGICADVTVTLEKFEPPLMDVPVVRRDQRRMVKKTLRKIKKDLSQRGVRTK